MIQLEQTRRFNQKYKKLPPRERHSCDEAIKKILLSPLLGEKKIGDLSFLRVYKYKSGTQQFLLGYEYEEKEQRIILTAFGPHENFYRDLKH